MVRSAAAAAAGRNKERRAASRDHRAEKAPLASSPTTAKVRAVRPAHTGVSGRLSADVLLLRAHDMRRGSRRRAPDAAKAFTGAQRGRGDLWVRSLADGGDKRPKLTWMLAAGLADECA
ncbi:MAG: hypothetical protein BJ554DRAFT_7463 [Olpidium bornovanus]|uniref:Uncharacterized protein n=1 Tax=Olpidium bornovanus TaxID=278681 RepID=A0A8H7ZW02_9FUNG|nr:MAG: hypothetical protein BJ554DRAFT_7463 [Olpidium bornovanus]